MEGDDRPLKWGFVASAGVAACVILLAPWRLLPTDAWLALATGREIAAHGLPHTDTLAVVTRGHVWTDQQWLGQLFIYENEHLFGLKSALVVQALVTAAAFGLCARYALRRGASPAATLVCSIAGFGVGATFFTLRPQMFSILGFAIAIVMLGEDVRKPSNKIWWVLPMLAIWANLHGVVIVGAAVVGLRAAFDVAHGALEKKIRRITRGVVLGVLAAATPFATPYARELPRYLHEIGRLQDPVRQLPIFEWNRVEFPSDWPFFTIFAAMLVLLVIVHWKKFSRPVPFETLVMAIMGFAAWQASRHLQWFGVALAAYAPVALDALPPVREGHVLAKVASLARIVAPIAFVGLVVRLYAMNEQALEREYPLGVLPVISRAMDEHPDSQVAASDLYADWLLWYVPKVEGRIEWDVRFELLDDAQARAMGIFLYTRAGWESLYPDAHIVLVARKAHKSLAAALEAKHAEVLWENDVARLYLR
jgi:hypothetical protein